MRIRTRKLLCGSGSASFLMKHHTFGSKKFLKNTRKGLQFANYSKPSSVSENQDKLLLMQQQTDITYLKSFFPLLRRHCSIYRYTIPKTRYPVQHRCKILYWSHSTHLILNNFQIMSVNVCLVKFFLRKTAKTIENLSTEK